MSDKTTNITEQELQAVRNGKAALELARLTAEKSVALSKLAETEVNNIILTIFNRHGLKSGEDHILENGTIVRAADAAAAQATQTEAPVVEGGK